MTLCLSTEADKWATPIRIYFLRWFFKNSIFRLLFSWIHMCVIALKFRKRAPSKICSLLLHNSARSKLKMIYTSVIQGSNENDRQEFCLLKIFTCIYIYLFIAVRSQLLKQNFLFFRLGAQDLDAAFHNKSRLSISVKTFQTIRLDFFFIW